MSICYQCAFEKWANKWFQYILDNINKNWDWDYLYTNINNGFCIHTNPYNKFIINETYNKEDIFKLSTNDTRGWFCLSLNENITWQTIIQHMDKPWNWSGVSLNPNIDWEIVEKNNNIEWDYELLSMNTMDRAREKFIRKELQEQFRKSDLYKELMETFWHPSRYDKFKYLLDLDND